MFLSRPQKSLLVATVYGYVLLLLDDLKAGKLCSSIERNHTNIKTIYFYKQNLIKNFLN